MAETWIDIEDTKEVVNAIVNEELDRIERKKSYCYEREEDVEEVSHYVVNRSIHTCKLWKQWICSSYTFMQMETKLLITLVLGD